MLTESLRLRSAPPRDAVPRGRMFTEDDRTRRPVVISQHAARTLWSVEDPIGRLVQRGAGEALEVVGVVADARSVWR